MEELNALLQLGGMGVMAFAAIALTRIFLPLLTALSDRLLDAMERQIQAIDRLGEVAASMDKRLIVVEQQIDMLQDLMHLALVPGAEPSVRPSKRRPVGGIPIPDGGEHSPARERKVGG